MKVIILAGGFGTRLSEYTDVIPKPMVPIGGKPILWHIMNSYAQYGHKDFYVALGYKADKVKEYFLNYKSLNSDFTIDLASGNLELHHYKQIDWKVTLVHTGENSMTGGRVKRMKSFIGNEPFLLTYGDGLSNININDLLDFHTSHGKMVTMSAVRPTARFGELKLKDNQIIEFKEKPQIHEGWINGGFFVIQPDFFDLIEGDAIMLEREPMEIVASKGELMAYKHEGFWHCMDTKRDHEFFEDLYKKDSPWIIK